MCGGCTAVGGRYARRRARHSAADDEATPRRPFVALEFSRPGRYEVTLSGNAQRVRLDTVTDVDASSPLALDTTDARAHYFDEWASFSAFMADEGHDAPAAAVTFGPF